MLPGVSNPSLAEFFRILRIIYVVKNNNNNKIKNKTHRKINEINLNTAETDHGHKDVDSCRDLLLGEVDESGGGGGVMGVDEGHERPRNMKKLTPNQLHQRNKKKQQQRQQNQQQQLYKPDPSSIFFSHENFPAEAINSKDAGSSAERIEKMRNTFSKVTAFLKNNSLEGLGGGRVMNLM